MDSLRSQVRLLSNDVLAGWLIEDFPFRIQLASVFPFFPIDGDSLRYATTPALTPGVTIGFDGGIPDDTKHPAEGQRRFGLAEIATRFGISYRAQDIFSSNVNDQTSVQMALAIRELLYRFWILFESGDARVEDQFDGLLKLVHPSQVVDLAGGHLTLESLDRAEELVRTNDGRAVVAFTSSLGKRAIHAAYWTRGLEPSHEEAAFPTPTGEMRSEQVLTFDGAPVFVNDLNQVYAPESQGCDEPVPPEDAASAESGTTNIWFFTLGENNLHGITPAALGDCLFVERHTIVPGGSTTEHHITMPTGIALGSASALSVVKNAAFPTADGGRPRKKR